MSDLTLSLDETIRILAWSEEHTASLRRHVSWLKSIKGEPLPGTEVAIPEIEKDIGLNLDLMTRLYEHRNDLQGEAPMSEPAPVPAGPEEALRGQKRAARANARADRAEGRVRLLLSRAMGAEEARDNARRHCGYLQTKVDQLASELREAREARDDLQAGFDLRWNADMRAIERWHAAGGHKLTWPDHADLVVWLVTQWLGDPGAEADRIPSFGFARGTVVREASDGPNMLVVRGLGETTAVIVIEGDDGGQVRLRERPTAVLRQVLAAGDYAEVKRAPTDWDPPALSDPRPSPAKGDDHHG